MAQNGQKSCFSSHHLKSSNGFCWPKSKMSHVTVKEMNIMSFVDQNRKCLTSQWRKWTLWVLFLTLFSPFLTTFWAIFTYAPGRGPNFYQKSSFLRFFTQNRHFFDDFFINCCKIGNVHKITSKKHQKIIDFYCVSTHFLLCFNPFLRLFLMKNSVK